jgi:hypothetical protein
MGYVMIFLERFKRRCAEIDGRKDEPIEPHPVYFSVIKTFAGKKTKIAWGLTLIEAEIFSKLGPKQIRRISYQDKEGTDVFECPTFDYKKEGTI